MSTKPTDTTPDSMASKLPCSLAYAFSSSIIHSSFSVQPRVSAPPPPPPPPTTDHTHWSGS
jgi:hypothetical protein